MLFIGVPGREASAFSQDVNLARAARNISSGLHVLYVVLQPGYEDLGVVAYYRMAKGARVRVAYLTNGDGGESDLRSTYPLSFAAQLRLEASAALESLEAEPHFLAMPALVSARDSTRAREIINADSCRARLQALIADFKPDLILIGKDRATEDELRFTILRDDALAAAAKAARQRETPWNTPRIAVESSAAAALTVPVQERDPLSGSSFRAMGDSVGRLYASVRKQREDWNRSAVSRFRVIVPSRGSVKSLDAGLPTGVPQRLQPLRRAIKSFAQSIGGQRGARIDRNRFSKQVLALMDSLDLRLWEEGSSASFARRLLIRWKAGIERIRNVLLGVDVQYTVSDTILTERQLTYLTINSATGTSEAGTTELYIPAIEQQWILDEDIKRKVPLSIGKDYRLLTPSSVEYNYPPAEYGLFSPMVRKPIYFFLLHTASDRSKSFVYRGDLRIWHAPRFTVEVLTPIVRAIPGERVLVRLTNHSRDGVRDTIYIQDSLAQAPGRFFRLNTKGASEIDTLTPVWSSSLTEGSHVVNFLIAGMPYGRFVVRKFPVRTDTSRRVAVLSAIENSSALDALRRIGYVPELLHATEFGDALTKGVWNTLLVDRRTFTLAGYPPGVSQMSAFVEKGGHIIFLAQDQNTLSTIPLLEHLSIQPSIRLDETTPVAVDAAQTIMRAPNPIVPQDFDGWITQMAYHTVRSSSAGVFDSPVSVAGTNEPLVLTRRMGAGRVTYVALALHHQWMNVHPGSLSLLANLVAAQ